MIVPIGSTAATPDRGVSLLNPKNSAITANCADATTSADGSRWATLYSALCDPAISARLLQPTSVDNEARPAGEGDPDALMLQAERMGGGYAVVATIRPDLVALDLDGCAAQIRPALTHAAEQLGAVLVYLARTGSEDSEHAVFGCPTDHSRARLLEVIAEVRAWSGLSAQQIDHRHGAGGAIRLPGSASLKSGRKAVTPISETEYNDDETPRALSATAATRRTMRALQALGLPIAYSSATDTLSRQESATPNEDHATVVPLRAWRPRRPFTPAELAALDTVPRPRDDRSQLALTAAWSLWTSGIRSWSDARTHYAKRLVFAKYAQRADLGRSHWTALADGWANYRGEVETTDQQRCDEWMQHAQTWTDHDAAAALVAVITHRFTDGRGITARPIPVRDLQGWLLVGRRRAHELLLSLVECGALVRVRAWADGPEHEGTLFDLGESVYRGNPGHEVHTPIQVPLEPSLVLAPVWSTLGHDARTLWTLLTPSGQTTQALALSSSLAPGDHSYGARLLLGRLEAAGLAVRSGRGRGLRWSVGPASLAAAATALGVDARSAELLARISHERAVWHSQTAVEQRAAQAELDSLRSAAPDLDLSDGPTRVRSSRSLRAGVPGRRRKQRASANPSGTLLEPFSNPSGGVDLLSLSVEHPDGLVGAAFEVGWSVSG